MEVSVADVFTGAGKTTALLRGIDWETSPLGPVRSWPAELAAAVRFCLESRAPMAVWCGPELLQIYNDAYAELCGNKHPRALAEPARTSWAEVWHEIGPLATDVLRRGEATYAENRLLLIDRHGYVEETYWTFSLSPIRAADGTVSGVLTIATDVTASVILERRLETVRQLGELSASTAGELTDVCRAAMKVLETNRQAVPFAAVLLREARGSTYALVASYGIRPGTSVTPHVLAAPEGAFARVLRSGAAELVDGLRSTAQRGALDPSPLGDVIPDAAMVLPVTVGAHDHPVAVLVLGVNPYRAVDELYSTFFSLFARQLSIAFSDVLALAEERERSQALVDLDESKRQFFQNISHEFRTPLTVILGPLNSLLDAGDAALRAEHRESVEAARRAALRLTRLVDTLLEFARAEAGELRIDARPTDLGQLTAELCGMFESVVSSAGLHYVVDVAQVREPVDIDREMWARIVLNLLSNAVKFTPTGRIEVRLHVTAERVELRVADTGIGIAADQIPLIFERFSQMRSAAARSREGAGIGLALVADLAAAHGGTVTVESEPGVGSTFLVSLPKQSSGDPAEPGGPLHGDDVRAYVAEAEGWAGAASPNGSKPAAIIRTPVGRLLLVEDNRDLSRYLERLLTDDGWTVETAADVDTALAVGQPPDVVVADVMLPGRSGLDLLAILREDAELRRIPVILLTARAGAESAAEGLRAGADDYIVKPFDPRELVARVRVHHELAQLREYALSQAEKRAANLQQALASNRHIGMAIGILMSRYKITDNAAFERMREVSQREHRKLRDIAEQVVLTGDLPLRSAAPAT